MRVICWLISSFFKVYLPVRIFSSSNAGRTQGPQEINQSNWTIKTIEPIVSWGMLYNVWLNLILAVVHLITVGIDHWSVLRDCSLLQGWGGGADWKRGGVRCLCIEKGRVRFFYALQIKATFVLDTNNKGQDTKSIIHQ